MGSIASCVAGQDGLKRLDGGDDFAVSGSCICLGEDDSASPVTIEFNPAKSYALCVGTQDSSASFAAGAVEMKTVLSSKLGIPESNIAVLTDGNATAKNVEKRYSEQAKKVEKDGLLFFSFSGHGAEFPKRRGSPNDKEFALVDSDEERIVASSFESGFHGFKGRNAVILLDCCCAGRLLESIFQLRWATRFDLYVLAAASKDEKTQFKRELGVLIFTFFMSCFLNREGAPGTFPISGALDHCKVLCPSLARLQYLTRQEMATQYESKSGYGNPLGKYRPKKTTGEESGEMAPVIKSHLHPLTSSFINKLMDDPDDDLLPQAIHEYFQKTAVESVRTLYSHGCLSPDFGQRYSTVFNCVLRLIVQSSAKILLDLKQLQSATSAGDDNAESVHPISQPGHPDIFLRVMKYVYWLFETALSSASTAEASHSPTKPVLQMRHFIKLPEKYFSLLIHQVSAQTKIKYWVMVKKCHAKIYDELKEPLDQMLDPVKDKELEQLPPLDLHQLIAKNITKLSLSAE
eukprot:scpid73383/ scgid4097/ 